MPNKRSYKNLSAPLFLRLVTPLFWPRRVDRLSVAPKTVFILSTGRTGTKFFADLISQLDSVIAVHEPKPSRVLQAWTSAFLEGKVSDRYMETALYNKRKRLLSKIKADLYVESNHFIDGFASHLDTVFENPMVIHVVRDPRDFITSMINRGNDRGLKLLINKYVPYFAYAPPGVKRRKMTPVQREAYHWEAMNRFLTEYGDAHSNYHLLKFEDLFAKDSPDKFNELLRVAGLTQAQIKSLDKSASSKNESRHQDMQPWESWTKEQRREVDQICGELMRQYGYGGEPEWQDSLR